jgi:CRP/FNR family transcriptional regulator, cyclic AMP receptor protein
MAHNARFSLTLPISSLEQAAFVMNNWVELLGYLTNNRVELLGYLAVSLMFSTFYMKNMIPLRIVGIISNIVFIAYTSQQHIIPVFILHTALLPMNCYRLAQMLRLIKQVRKASEGDMSFEFMIPHMSKEFFQQGDIVFRKGDRAEKIYLLQSGALSADELDVAIKPGEIFGEMGVFASEQVRLATLRCKTNVELLSMTDKQIRQLYYQNPDFGFYLIQLLLKRFSQNEACAATEGSGGGAIRSENSC